MGTRSSSNRLKINARRGSGSHNHKVPISGFIQRLPARGVGRVVRTRGEAAASGTGLRGALCRRCGAGVRARGRREAGAWGAGEAAGEVRPSAAPGEDADGGVCRPSKSTRGGSQRERSFAMLGFTHYWGRSRKGRWVVKRKTAKDRFSRALKGIGQWCRSHRHWKLRDQQAALSRKLRGHYAYYGITGNYQALHRFRFEVERLRRKWLGRRSWRGRMTWERFARLRNTYPLPAARVVRSVYR